MNVKVTTYKTLTGKRRYLETLRNTNHQWIIYNGKKPTYYVDLFDLKTESNVILNSLIFTSKKTIEDVVAILNKKYNLNLLIPKVPAVSLKVKSELKEFDLAPVPKEWLDYSL